MKNAPITVCKTVKEILENIVNMSYLLMCLKKWKTDHRSTSEIGWTSKFNQFKRVKFGRHPSLRSRLVLRTDTQTSTHGWSQYLLCLCRQWPKYSEAVTMTNLNEHYWVWPEIKEVYYCSIHLFQCNVLGQNTTTCLSCKPLWYTALGMGCTSSVQYLCQLSLLSSVGDVIIQNSDGGCRW